jgi:hypothetical protein
MIIYPHPTSVNFIHTLLSISIRRYYCVWYVETTLNRLVDGTWSDFTEIQWTRLGLQADRLKQASELNLPPLVA